jgi:GH15 family glucan-1,4-alpha-glucosidase
VDRTLEVLTVHDLVYRYLGADDGLPGGEATFTFCTFWLVEVLAMQGRLAEARRILDVMVKRSSPLGLFAEEIHPATNEHLGNFPQAFPHIGLVNAVRRLAVEESRLAAPQATP